MPPSTRRDELLKRRLDPFTQMLHGARKQSVRSLHRTRVASRRLREVLPVLQLEAEVARKLGRRLRRLTEELGAVRQLDVLHQMIEELADSGRYDQPSLAYLSATISGERDRAREDLWRSKPAGRIDRIASKLDHVTEDLKASDAPARDRTKAGRALQWAIDARVASRAGALHAALQAAGAVYLPERLHSVRIALKKLRYAVEVAADTGGSQKVVRDLTRLKRAQTLLGRMHDLQVLIDRVRQESASLPIVELAHGMDSLVAALENDCRRLHARFVRERRPLDAIAERLSAPLSSHHVVRRAG